MVRRGPRVDNSAGAATHGSSTPARAVRPTLTHLLHPDLGHKELACPSVGYDITATLVMSLVIDAIRKMTASVMGRASSISITPWLCKRTSLPRQATAETTPATRAWSISDWKSASTLASRSAEMPTEWAPWSVRWSLEARRCGTLIRDPGAYLDATVPYRRTYTFRFQ